MILRPPKSTRTDTLFPYTTLFRSRWSWAALDPGSDGRGNPVEQLYRLFIRRIILYIVSIGSAMTAFLASEGSRRQRKRAQTANHLSATAFRLFETPGRPEARRVGKECVSTGRSRWSPDHSNNINLK